MKNNFENFMGALGILAMAIILLGFPLQLLWNWLMPDIFNLPRIGFWQAVGINILCTILFKPSTSTITKNND